MFKVYKRTFHIGQTTHSDGLESSSDNRVLTGNGKTSGWLTVPGMIAGVVVGALVFSVFFVAILIPLGILGIKAWSRLQKQNGNSPVGQAIDAEYTVVTEPSKINEKPAK